MAYAVASEDPRGPGLLVREIPPRPRLLDRVRDAVRTRHYSRRTEKAYVHWIKRYIFFHDKRHSAEMGAAEVGAFLTALAVRNKVAASTQNQALSALLFLYREVLGAELPWLDDVVRAKRPLRLPVVLTRDEVRAVLQRVDGVPRLMAILLYGAGLRLLECCRLRVKDIDFATNQITIRDGKGHRDRATMLPAAVKAGLAVHLERVREQHQADLRHGADWVELPGALIRTRTQAATGAGNGSSPPPVSTWIALRDSGVGTTSPSPCTAWLGELHRSAWVVYCKPPFAGPDHVLAYLGRYTHRVALSNDRLVAVVDGRVRFRWRDYADGDRVKLIDLAVAEFLRRFLLHIVPDGFVRIRHFGLLANRRRRAALAPAAWDTS